jgi:6-phosphogluconolactonase
VANNGANSVQVFAIDSTTGGLKEISASPFPAGEAPLALEMDEAGKLLYVANSIGKSVTVFAVDAATGRLQPLQTLATPGFACSVVVIAGLGN